MNESVDLYCIAIYKVYSPGAPDYYRLGALYAQCVVCGSNLDQVTNSCDWWCVMVLLSVPPGRCQNSTLNAATATSCSVLFNHYLLSCGVMSSELPSALLSKFRCSVTVLSSPLNCVIIIFK
jgi:hypothetical protein